MVRALESVHAPVAGTLLGITQCPLTDHVGTEGRLTHTCLSCSGGLLCRSCLDDHLVAGHAVVPVETASAEAAASLNSALPILQQGLRHQGECAALARAGLAALTQARSTALVDLQNRFAFAQSALEQARTELHAAIMSAFDHKARELTATLTAARSAGGELATVSGVAEIALAHTDSPLLVLHAHACLCASEPLARDNRVHHVDTTLQLARVDGVHTEFGLGRVVTACVDPGRSSLAWSPAVEAPPVVAVDGSEAVGTVAPGQQLVAHLSLCRHDGGPAEVVGDCTVTLTTTLTVTTGEALGTTSCEAGGASSATVALSRVAPGTYHATLPAPDAPPGATLWLSARVQGVHVRGSPLRVRYAEEAPMVVVGPGPAPGARGSPGTQRHHLWHPSKPHKASPPPPTRAPCSLTGVRGSQYHWYLITSTHAASITAKTERELLPHPEKR